MFTKPIPHYCIWYKTCAFICSAVCAIVCETSFLWLLNSSRIELLCCHLLEKLYWLQTSIILENRHFNTTCFEKQLIKLILLFVSLNFVSWSSLVASFLFSSLHTPQTHPTKLTILKPHIFTYSTLNSYHQLGACEWWFFNLS